MTGREVLRTEYARNMSMCRFVKKRLAELVEEHGSLEKVEDHVGIFLPMLKLYWQDGCRADTPDANEVLTRLAKDEKELGELWETYLPEYTQSWDKLKSKHGMTISDCVAFMLVTTDLEQAKMFQAAGGIEGIARETLKEKWGEFGILSLELLAKLGHIRCSEDCYFVDSEHEEASMLIYFVVCDQLARHHKRLEDEPDYQIDGFIEWLKQHEAKLEREALN